VFKRMSLVQTQMRAELKGLWAEGVTGAVTSGLTAGIKGAEMALAKK